MYDPRLHNAPFQVLILTLKSSKDGAHLILGGSLFQIFNLLLHIAMKAFHAF